jgi:hypothetical protein
MLGEYLGDLDVPMEYAKRGMTEETETSLAAASLLGAPGEYIQKVRLTAYYTLVDMAQVALKWGTPENVDKYLRQATTYRAQTHLPVPSEDWLFRPIREEADRLRTK